MLRNINHEYLDKQEVNSHMDFGNREKAQSIFDWGKYHEKEGKLMMPFAVQVHHAFVDGFILANLRIRGRDTCMKCRL